MVRVCDLLNAMDFILWSRPDCPPDLLPSSVLYSPPTLPPHLLPLIAGLDLLHGAEIYMGWIATLPSGEVAHGRNGGLLVSQALPDDMGGGNTTTVKGNPSEGGGNLIVGEVPPDVVLCVEDQVAPDPPSKVPLLLPLEADECGGAGSMAVTPPHVVVLAEERVAPDPTYVAHQLTLEASDYVGDDGMADTRSSKAWFLLPVTSVILKIMKTELSLPPAPMAWSTRRRLCCGRPPKCVGRMSPSAPSRKRLCRCCRRGTHFRAHRFALSFGGG